MKTLSQISQGDVIDFTRRLATPFLMLDLNQARKNIRRIRRALPNAALFYAVKCNTDQRLLEAVERAGIGFEVASLNGAEAVLQLETGSARVHGLCACCSWALSDTLLSSNQFSGIATISASPSN